KQYTDKTEDNVAKLREQNEQLVAASVELRSSYEQIEYLAHHDTPTSLPNRASLLQQAASEDADESSLFLAIGLDRLAEVGQAFGTSYADEALRDIGGRLVEELSRKDACIARIGEDRLGLYLHSTGNRLEAADLA